MTIKELRIKAGKTQREFSKYLGIPKRSIENWESGRRNPPPYLVDLIKHKLEEGMIKEIYADEGQMIFLAINGITVMAIGNVENILDYIEDDINEYMEKNNINMVNILISNDFDVLNYEKSR